MTKLTPETFDALARDAHTHVRAREDRIIWTAAAIAGRLGCGEEYVRRTLAKLPGSPIHQKGRRLYAFEADLMAWMRGNAV